jgi:tRNA(Ile)-lysidine synthase
MPPSSTPSNPDDLLTTVAKTLTTHQMLTPGDQVLVGVSGGPDSMALLHLLSRLAPALNVRLRVAHLNHCLRGASADRDAEVVCQAAAALGYACHVSRARVLKVKRQLGLSLEEAARRVRYAFFKKTMRDVGCNKLALGHHLDDNAEQMLMVLLRGTGPQGLSGIAPVRENRIIRPLINSRRSQIEAFVKQEGITCVRDASNDDRRFVRNRIRHCLLPLLSSEYDPRIVEHLNRLADVIRLEETWIAGLAARPYQEAILDRGPGTITLSAGSLRQAHTALARRLVRMALKDLTGTLQRISFAHVRSVLYLLTAGGTEKEIHLPNGIRVRLNADRLVLLTAGNRRRKTAQADMARDSASETPIDGPFPATVEIRSMGIGLRFSPCPIHQLPRWSDVGRNRAFIDMDRLSLPLAVRTPLAGDRFTPLGAAGSQKLKKFFIDHRIPRQARFMAPLLADQRGIIWLVGQRIDDYVKVTTATSRVLGVEFFLLDTR